MELIWNSKPQLLMLEKHGRTIEISGEMNVFFHETGCHGAK